MEMPAHQCLCETYPLEIRLEWAGRQTSRALWLLIGTVGGPEIRWAEIPHIVLPLSVNHCLFTARLLLCLAATLDHIKGQLKGEINKLKCAIQCLSIELQPHLCYFCLIQSNCICEPGLMGDPRVQISPCTHLERRAGQHFASGEES